MQLRSKDLANCELSPLKVKKNMLGNGWEKNYDHAMKTAVSPANANEGALSIPTMREALAFQKLPFDLTVFPQC
jgi:hypothetical protein